MNNINDLFWKGGLLLCVITIFVFLLYFKNVQIKYMDCINNPVVKTDTIQVENKVIIHDTIYRYRMPITENKNTDTISMPADN